MKKIGIIGGLGPEATIDYYKELINAFKNESGDLNYPEIIIYSVNMSEFTMEASFYPDVFKKQGIEVVMPDEEDKELINNKLLQDFKHCYKHLVNLKI